MMVLLWILLAIYVLGAGATFYGLMRAPGRADWRDWLVVTALALGWPLVVALLSIASFDDLERFS